MQEYFTYTAEHDDCGCDKSGTRGAEADAEARIIDEICAISCPDTGDTAMDHAVGKIGEEFLCRIAEVAVLRFLLERRTIDVCPTNILYRQM
jgi:hypothetical protein